MGEVGPVVLGNRYAALAGAEAWAAFLFATISSATWSFCSAPGWTDGKAGRKEVGSRCVLGSATVGWSD